MISEFLIIASICGFSLGLTACCIFLFTSRENAFSNRLLALTFFSLTTIMVVTFLLEWNLHYFAYVYRFPSPLYYLILPAAWLYLRTVINKETKFRKTDWLHFLPATIHFIEMLPFYFTTYEYRLSIVKQLPVEPRKLLALEEGWLPPNYHIVIRFIQGCIYIILMVVALVKARKRLSTADPQETATFHWLATFTSMMAVLAFPMIIYFIFPGTNAIQSTRLLFTVISASFLITNLYLFFRPQILYGIPGSVGFPPRSDNETVRMNHEKEEKNNEPSQPAVLNLEYYKPILEQYIATEKPFLKQGYTISELSVETGIPQHHLSALLNRVYEMRFTDFLNRMRIRYIRENFHQEGWHQLTLEGIAKIAGFNSRTTFFNAIKKATGLTPSEFMAEIKMNKKEVNSL